MKILESTNLCRIYGDDLIVKQKLEARTYLVNMDNNNNFYLSKVDTPTINEKIYGVHSKKVDKVFNAWNSKNFQDKNLGVILSGEKGTGKSLTAKMISIKAIKEYDLPVLLINNKYDGFDLSEFIESIKQEVVILFDEFDKIYSKGKEQEELLSLFDGMSTGKKMFIITCNEVNKLSDYIIDRTGRFHYHFRFGFLTEEEIREYMEDKIKECYKSEIKEVTLFNNKINLNYDKLRAICIELNSGISFKECLEDLNIVNLYEGKELYNFILLYENGEKLINEQYANLFDNNLKVTFDIDYADIATINCDLSNAKQENEKIIINAKYLNIKYYKELEEMYEKYSNLKPKALIITKTTPMNIKYAL